MQYETACAANVQLCKRGAPILTGTVSGDTSASRTFGSKNIGRSFSVGPQARSLSPSPVIRASVGDSNFGGGTVTNALLSQHAESLGGVGRSHLEVAKQVRGDVVPPPAVG